MRPPLSSITDTLFISAWPDAGDVESLLQHNIRLVLSMHWWMPDRRLRQPPLRLLWLPTIDSPFTPMPMWAFRNGVEAALPVIEQRQGVLCHCRWGVHRSAAMACCILIATGSSADDAMALVKQRRPAADPYIWYIRSRIRKFEGYWRPDETMP